MVRLTLISHGSTAAVREGRFAADEPLDGYGIRQARTAGQSGRPIRGRVLCDDSQRTRQTSAALGLDPTLEADISVGPGPVGPIEVDPALRDLDVGRWRGRRLDEIPAGELGQWLTDVTYAPAGGESVQQLLARVRRWLGHRAEEPGRIVAVTHPAVVRAALVTALNCPPEMFWRIDVAPLTATLLYHRGPTTLPSTGAETGWTLTRAGHPL